MRAYPITGKPGSRKSALAAELSRRGLIAVGADGLAFWEDSIGRRVGQPSDPDDGWLLAHRWVWSRAQVEQCIAAPSGGAGRMFFCGIARNQTEMLDLFEQVFLLVIDDDTQEARLASPAQTASPARAEAVKRQIREGRPVFQAQMLTAGAIPLDGTALTKALADTLLAELDLLRTSSGGGFVLLHNARRDAPAVADGDPLTLGPRPYIATTSAA